MVETDRFWVISDTGHRLQVVERRSVIIFRPSKGQPERHLGNPDYQAADGRDMNCTADGGYQFWDDDTQIFRRL